MKKSRLLKKFKRLWGRPLGFGLQPSHLLQVPVPLVKRVLLCVLIVAAGVISLDRVGGPKISVNFVEERRCNCLFFVCCCFQLNKILFLPVVCVFFSFNLVPFHFILVYSTSYFCYFGYFYYSAFPFTFLGVIRRLISITPYNPFTTDSWSSSVSGVSSLLSMCLVFRNKSRISFLTFFCRSFPVSASPTLSSVLNLCHGATGIKTSLPGLGHFRHQKWLLRATFSRLQTSFDYAIQICLWRETLPLV